jgi:gas vesicle protein
MKTSLIFLLGMGMGVALGLLTAPEAGKITRRKIRKEADRLIDRTLAKRELKKLIDSGLVTTTAVEPIERFTLSR